MNASGGKRGPVSGKYWKNVGTVVSGTTIGQLIPVAATPILTRMYTPQEFGVLASFISIATIITVAANGRYEVAIVLPERSSHASALAGLSIYLAIGTAALTLGLVHLFGQEISQFINTPTLRDWLYLLPFVVLINGVYNTAKYIHNRNSNYRNIARSEIARSTIGTGGQISAGAAGLGTLGIVGGFAVGQAGGAVMYIAAKKTRTELAAGLKSREICRVARRYARFPLLSLPSALANAMATHLINVLIAAAYSTAQLGHYSITQRVLGLPSAIIGVAVGQVFYREATTERAERGSAIRAYDRTTKRLALLSFPMFTVAYFLAPSAFAIVLGEEWRGAGELTRALVPLFAVRFVVSAVSMTTVVFERQGVALVWQLALLAIGVAAIIIATANSLSFEQFAALYALASGAHYVFLYFIMRNIAKGHRT